MNDNTLITNNNTKAVDDGWLGYRHIDTDTEGWSRFWRLDPRGADLDLASWPSGVERELPPLWMRATTPAGVHGRWKVGSGRIRIEVFASNGMDCGTGPIDILLDGKLAQRARLRPQDQWVEVDVPGPGVAEIWLPHVGALRIRRLELPPGSVASPVDGPQWTTYGSSITQAAQASGPSQTWPALAARAQKWRLTALGLAGECHLDEAAARTIAAVPADLVSLCLGINIWTASSFNERTLAGAIARFISVVRATQPEVPILVITPLATRLESSTNSTGMTLSLMRSLIETGATSGGADLVLDGRDVLRPDEQGLLLDDVHPSDEAQALIAERLTPSLTSLLRDHRAGLPA